MEASSSKATDGLVPEGLELEDLWSELQALKKLYGLLQKRDVKITNGDSSHECLDEKSRHVLKNLLDGATHQALQSQAKIVCYTPEPHHPLAKAENLELKASGSTEKDEDNPEEFQKCEQDAVQQGKAESAQSSSPPVKATPSQSRNKHEPDPEQRLGRKPCSSVDRESDLVTAKSTKAESAQSSIPHGPKLKLAEHNLRRKPCPSISKGDLTRQNSRRSTAISEKRSTQHHPHRHIRRDDRRSSKPRTRNNTNRRNQNQNQNQATVVDVLEQEHKIKSAPDPNEVVKPRQSNVDLLAIMPAEKRARVGPIGLPGQSSRSQTRAVDRIDRELTHSKRGDTKGKMRQKSRPPSRMGSINDRESKSIVLRDQNLIVGRIKERPRPEQRSRDRPRSKPPSLLGSLKEGEIKSIDTLRDQNRSVSNSRGRNQVEHRNFSGFPGKPRRMQPVAYSSSSSGTMQSDTSATTSSSSRCRFTRRMGPTRPTRPPPPRRMPSRGRNGGRQPKKNKEEEGRLKRFKNKLAVIFHHHHHLHVGGGQHGGSQQIKHRSPWAYIKSVVSTGEGKGREVAAKGPARVAAHQQQRGYFYAMLEGLIRHVWGKGRRKKIGGGGRVKGKKLHWWQRFWRRGGFKVANKKKTPRVRLLGFNRSHSRNTRNK